MNKFLLVAAREYVKTVRKPSFWLATLLFPVLIGVFSFVSGYSAQVSEEKIREQAENVESVLLVDPGEIISPLLISPPYQVSFSLDEAVEQVRHGEVDAAFYYPEDIFSEKSLQVIAQDNGLAAREQFNEIARQLVKQSILLSINDLQMVELFNSSISVDTTHYKDGEEVVTNIEMFIVPVVSLILYFILVFMASNFLLMSVSEEKENRMIEIVMSIMKPSQLISGKIIGLVAVAITQVAVLSSLSGVILYFTLDQLPFGIDLSQVVIEPFQVISSLFYILVGFLMLATIMVGVGAAMPTYKEAQNFASFFIILSVSPLYFITIIVTDPTGTVAMITSYFPLTAPLILLARSGLGELPVLEMLASVPILIAYVWISFWIAFKLFEIGALEYSKKLSLRSILKRR